MRQRKEKSGDDGKSESKGREAWIWAFTGHLS